MQPTLCKLIYNHKWKQKHRYRNQYLYECQMCGKVEAVDSTKEKEKLKKIKLNINQEMIHFD